MDTPTRGRWRAFQGPNGWYIAVEDADGYHHQPADGGHMTREEARRAAQEAQAQEQEEAR